MSKTLIKIERIITQSKEIEVDLPGDDEAMIDESVDEYIEKNKEKLAEEDDKLWELDDVQVNLGEVLAYPEFDEEE